MTVEEIIIIFVLNMVIFFVIGFSVGRMVGAKEVLKNLNKWLIEKAKEIEEKNEDSN